jgi:lipopolysaccharide transport system permease protein
MTTFIYTAEPELKRPRDFLGRSFRDLGASAAPAWALFVSSLRAEHRRSWFGYLWLIIPAVGLATLCTFILSQRVVAVGRTELPYPVFVFSGMVLWQIFVDALNAPLDQLKRSRQLITRSVVSHEAVIGVGALQALLNAAVRLCALAVLILAFGVPVGWGAWLFPVGLLAMFVTGLAVGVATAPLGLLYDDLGRGLFLAVGFLFFVTPVAYPLPERGLFRLNPFAILIDTSRGWLTGGSGGAATFTAVSTVALAALVLAWLSYRIARPHLVARLG